MNNRDVESFDNCEESDTEEIVVFRFSTPTFPTYYVGKNEEGLSQIFNSWNELKTKLCEQVAVGSLTGLPA